MCVSARTVLRSLGQEIRERRKARNLSQEALALQAEIHPNVVGRLERGIYNPSVKLLLKITARLNTTLMELFADAAKRE